MKRFRVTIETENLVCSGIVHATNQGKAWHGFKMKLFEMHPEHMDEISEAEPMFRELGPSDKLVIDEYGVDEIVSRT